MGEEKKKELLQWHPAFYAGIQIEFGEEAEYLEFESEHMLGSKPMQVDVLIIKKESAREIKKNIGRIFRIHNLVEYKSPEDSLTVDDFYKVYGYACFYKADTKKADEISAKDITVSFVCSRYPQKLADHLTRERCCSMEVYGAGIYYIRGLMFATQLIVTKQLSEEENLWLKNLTNDLGGDEEARKLLRVYEKHQAETLYQSVMNVIVRANEERFKVSNMCEALEELMKDRIKELEEKAVSRGMEKGMKEGMEKGMKEGMEEGMKEGMKEGIKEGMREGMEKGMEKGIEKGIEKGVQQTLLAQIRKKLEKGKSLEQIADELEETEDVIWPLYNQLRTE